MAYAKLKTEMKGDTSRWTTRADAKVSAKKRRRVADVTAVVVDGAAQTDAAFDVWALGLDWSDE